MDKSITSEPTAPKAAGRRRHGLVSVCVKLSLCSQLLAGKFNCAEAPCGTENKLNSCFTVTRSVICARFTHLHTASAFMFSVLHNNFEYNQRIYDSLFFFFFSLLGRHEWGNQREVSPPGPRLIRDPSASQLADVFPESGSTPPGQRTAKTHIADP